MDNLKLENIGYEFFRDSDDGYDEFTKTLEDIMNKY
jgi:hypothetical protein